MTNAALQHEQTQARAVAETITALARRLNDGISYETLLELQTEARRLFNRINRT